MHKQAPIETRPLKYEEVTTPVVTGNEVLIKVEACGVCRSQLHAIEGDMVAKKIPLIPGHELAGKIVKVGKDVKILKVGDRVGMQPTYSTCGNCEYCRSGRENLCDAMVRIESIGGGYAQYVKGVEPHVYKIPDNIGFSKASSLFCAGATAYRAVKLAEPSPYKTVAIFGIGGVGHMAIQFAKLAGAKVIAVGRDEKKLKLAAKLGATAINEKDEEKLMKVGIDSSIIFAPSSDIASLAQRATKKGGIVVVGALHTELKGFDAKKELTIKGCYVGAREEVINTLKAASEGKISVEFTEYPLRQANEVLIKMKKGELVGRAVLIP